MQFKEASYLESRLLLISIPQFSALVSVHVTHPLTLAYFRLRSSAWCIKKFSRCVSRQVLSGGRGGNPQVNLSHYLGNSALHMVSTLVDKQPFTAMALQSTVREAQPTLPAVVIMQVGLSFAVRTSVRSIGRSNDR